MTRFDLERTVLAPQHIRVQSSRGYLGFPEGTISGVRGLGFPPFVAQDYCLLFTVVDPVSGRSLRDWEEYEMCDSVDKRVRVGKFPDAADARSLYHGAEWLGWAIERKGSVHWREKGHLISFRLRTIVAPLTTCDGYCLRLEFDEIRVPGEELVLKLEHTDFHFGAVKSWDWVEPEAKTQAVRTAPGEFTGHGAALCIGVAEGTLEADTWRIPLENRKSLSVHLSVTIAPKAEEARENLAKILSEPGEHLQKAESRWNLRRQELHKSVPEFRCDLPELEAFYNGGLNTLLTSRWDTPAFLLQPYFATSGFGFSSGAYFWDMSYCPRVVTLWEPEAMRRHIIQWLSVDLHSWNQFSPFDGSGMGGWYALNDFSITKMVHQYCCVTGDREILGELAGDRNVLERLEQLLANSEERFENRGGLLNFGRNENLLELRSSGYEGFVASPNGERYYCWQRLAELKEWVGLDAAAGREHADSVKAGFFDMLWNEDAGWPDAITPEGNRETPYSIQVFNLLSSGLFEGEKLERLLSHLNDREFLSSHGPESISKADIRYELNDLDWSGGGTYVGCGPVMAIDLYHSGRASEAWNVLRRILWWAEVLPYYPQIVRSRRPGYCERERPTCIAGGSATEAVIFGIFGLRYELDGSASICVNLPPGVKNTSLRNIALRDGHLDILVLDGQILLDHEGLTREVALGERILL